MDRAALESNQRTLLGCIRSCASDNSHPAPSVDHRRQARGIATSIPLSHGASLDKFIKITESGNLLCQDMIPGYKDTGSSPSDEEILGTSGFVFLYAAPFRYPSSVCGFLFRRTLEEAERDTGMASPFDSGALIKHFMRAIPLEPPTDFLKRHEMPIPDHREILQESLELLFEDPWHYIDGRDPRYPNPFGLMGGDTRRWTHEVRIPEKVSVRHHIEAVFVVTRRAMDPRIVRYLKWCEANGVHYETLRTPSGGAFSVLQRACVNYVHKLLQE